LLEIQIVLQGDNELLGVNVVNVKTLHLKTIAYMAIKMKLLSIVQNTLKWLTTEDNHLFEEKMFSHNTSKYGSKTNLYLLSMLDTRISSLDGLVLFEE